ncbi:MAG: hypothetical protein ACKPBA_03485 [Planctomycetota bacterium]
MKHGGARTVLDLFDAACARHPGAVALDIPPASGAQRVEWTYSRLADASRCVCAAVAPHATPDAVVVLTCRARIRGFMRRCSA